MTAAYDLFVSELHATGKAYGDGFSPGHFAKLTPDERASVRQALLDGLQGRQPRAPQALAVLDPGDATLTVLRPLMPPPDAVPTDFELEVAAAIALLSTDAQALQVLEQQMRRDDSLWNIGVAKQGLSHAAVGSDASARLARLLRTNGSQRRQMAAADALLQRHGWPILSPDRSAECLQLLGDLIGTDAAVREAALMKVLKAPVRDWLAAVRDPS